MRVDEKVIKDCELIVKAIKNGNFKNYDEKKLAILKLYVPDQNFSRAGIIMAIKKLEVIDGL